MDGVTKAAMRTAFLSVAATIVVVAVKLAAAWLSGSVSVLAEGLQSTADVLMSLVAAGTIRYAAQPPDEDHPYGHGKAEVLASAFQMLLVLGSGAYILIRAYWRFNQPEPIRWDWGAWAMAYAVLSNTLVSFRLSSVARQSGSAALASEALHLRADTYSSIGVLVGMLLVGIFGWLWLDPAVAALSVVLGMALAVRHLRLVIHSLMDGSLPAEDVALLEAVLQESPQVRGYHNLRTRTVGSRRFVELHAMLDDHLTFVEAHELAEQIEKQLGLALGGATVSIHYEPHEAELEHRAREHPSAK
jgi:cation diffusion facilitator family transporter